MLFVNVLLGQGVGLSTESRVFCGGSKLVSKSIRTCSCGLMNNPSKTSVEVEG